MAKIAQGTSCARNGFNHEPPKLERTKRIMNELSTCKTCSEDYLTESMIQDIEGALYCLVDSGEICPNCGKFGHECEQVSA